MRIFITGATGFIGVHLTKRLVRQHHDVTVLLRTKQKRKLLPHRVEVIHGNMSIFQDETLELPPFDVVIHLAGQIFAKTAHEYHDANCEATKDLVRCIVRQDWDLKRFVFASSLAAAGPSGDENILDEDNTPHPIDPYGHAKLMAEEFLSTVAAFPTTSFRPAIVLGPGDENTLTLFKMAKYRLGMSINGKPQLLSFIDVDDLNDAIIKMIGEETDAHKTYFVAHPDIISNEDIFFTLGEVMGHRVFIVPLPKFGLTLASRISQLVSDQLGITNQLDEKQVLQLSNDFMCSGDKLKRELQWEPRRNLHSSIQKAYDGYRSAGQL